MPQRQQREHIHTNPTKTKKQDFVRSSEGIIREQQRKNHMRILANRRIAVFLIFTVAVCATLTFMLFNKKELLAEKEQQRIVAEENLAEIQTQHEMLNLQIAKLQDDEYIAKLARKEYFLSEEGEIIFTIPTDNTDPKTANEEAKAD